MTNNHNPIKIDHADIQVQPTSIFTDQSTTPLGAIALSPNEIMAQRILRTKQPFFVNTPTAANILAEMDSLLRYPKKNRMPCMMLIGEPSSGKSRLLMKFRDMHKRMTDPTDYKDRQPVVLFELGDAHMGGFYDDALTAMNIPFPLSHNTQQKEQHFLRTCKALDVKLLIIDEFHNGQQTSNRGQLALLGLVRHVTNVLNIPLVIAGVDEVRTFLDSDPQLSTRFVTRKTIPLWQESKEYRGFLGSLEMMYALKNPSNLATDAALGTKILMMTEGLTGEIVWMLEAAAEKAILTGEERITASLLDTLKDGKPWPKPSERQK